MSVTWRGQRVRVQIEDATTGAIDEVLDRCVNDAKAGHPFQNRTGKAEASIQAKPATQSATKISGRWGSYRVRYFFYLEMGTSKMPEFPTLRPSADKNYPELPRLIRERASL